MAFKPNYNQQRAERNRAKQAKKDDKLRQQQEQVAQRKSGGTSSLEPAFDTEPGSDTPDSHAAEGSDPT